MKGVILQHSQMLRRSRKLCGHKQITVKKTKILFWPCSNKIHNLQKNYNSSRTEIHNKIHDNIWKWKKRDIATVDAKNYIHIYIY